MMKIALLLAVTLAVAYASQYAPGSVVTTVTSSTTTTTVSAGDSDDSGLLSASDRAIIRKTWEQARKDGDVAPQILFRFVKAHPEYQKLFRSFASVPQDELLGNGNFLAQAYTILAGLNVVIQSLGSRELLANQLNALGGAHFSRGATPVMFDEFGAIAMDVLAEELGSAFNAEAKAAWTTAVRGLNAGIVKTLKAPEDLVDPQTRLSGHIIKDVQRSWENVRGNRNTIVAGIFQKLFAGTPRLQKAFSKFAKVAAADLSANADFNKQVALVADRLDVIISAMDDKLQLLGNINYMRYSHEPRGISRQTFEDFAELLIESLASSGVAADDLSFWKGALAVFVNGVTPKH
uniref:Hemoglobin chain n=1 Tax=Moina macrocopa TaxID=150844 RepID=Q966U2_9CRUS|nr:hemoglobin chain [Moina macrocopa]